MQIQINIPYGKKNVKIDIPEDSQILVPKKVKILDENKLIEDALENPIGFESYDEFADNSKRILVIINDATRPTPTSKILKYLLPVLSSHPDVKFLIATGVHRAPTDEEYKYILGDTYNIFRRKVYAHDARKDEDIIEMNHKLALSDEARSLALEGNPVNEDMVDAMNVLKDLNVFSIQTVLTGDHKLFAVTAGDLHKSFNAAIEFSNQIFCVPLKEKGNIVLTAAPFPMDIDLYQSQKALDNGKLALEDDGVIILISKCRTGVGEDTFLELLCRADTPEDIFNILGEEYKLGFHKAAKMAQIGIRAEMWAVTDLDDAIIKKAMLKPYSDIQIATDDAIKLIKSKGKKPRIVVLPFGSLTVPLI